MLRTPINSGVHELNNASHVRTTQNLMSDDIYERRYSQASSTDRPESTVPSFAPPRYSLIFQNDVSERVGTSESEPPTSTYSFSLSTKGQPWVTLNIQTRLSKTIRKCPRFFGSDNVSGTIDLNLDKPQVINSINLLVTSVVVFLFWHTEILLVKRSNSHHWHRSFKNRTMASYYFSWRTPCSLGKVQQRSSSSNSRIWWEIIWQLPVSLLIPFSRSCRSVIQFKEQREKRCAKLFGMLSSTDDSGARVVRERGLPVNFENYTWTAAPW